MKFKGQALTPESFILFYTTFLMIVVYFSGLFGQTILTNVPAKPTATGNTFLDAVTNIMSPFGYFLALLTTDAVPEFRTIMAIIITPAVILTIFIIAKHLPIIGSG
jgi:phosphoglycerol transferase MdoB-like AlkP superfamily enzyme